MSYFKNFHYQIIGDESKPKLVFLHGLMGSGANWRRVLPQFSDAFNILIFDQRGHGRSFQPESGYTPEDYAGDLEKILDELGWEKVYLVGHSMGGRNAQCFAANSPDRVIKLVVEDIGPSRQDENADNIRHLISVVPTPFPAKKQAREFFQQGHFEDKIPDNPNGRALAQYFYTNIEEKEDGTADWRFLKSAILDSVEAGHLQDRWEDVRKLNSPTLVIRGEFSKELTRSDFQRMLKENPKIQGVEIADSGHWVHFDQIEEFISVLKDFLLDG